MRSALFRGLGWLAIFAAIMGLTGFESDSASGKTPAKQLTTVQDESWTSLPLAGSTFHSQPPLVAQKDENPSFTRELVQLQWRTGDPIDLWVMRPKGVTKPPVILYLYGYPSETDRFRDNDYCDRITRNGFAAVGFVSALTGHRYHDRPMKKWFVSELQESLATSTHDVQLILNYLSDRGDLDMTNVGMFGEGSGATIAILAAAVDPSIKTLDVLDPWADWPEWMKSSFVIPEEERKNYIRPEFLAKIAPLDPVLWFPQLKTPHIRLQHVGDDSATPQAAKQHLEGVAPKGAVIQRYEDTKQLFTAVSGGRLFDWMKDQMRSPSQKANDTTASQPQPAQLPVPGNRN